MTRIRDEITVVEKVVVAFDVCSSSTIIEDLTLTNNLKAMRDILILTKKFLREKSKEIGFIRYKFTGDGWILLFPMDIRGVEMMDFLTGLSKYFKGQFTKRVLSVLDEVPDVTGLTFGLDRGNLIRVIMDQKNEYVGRPINVACRLQSVIKQKDTAPQYKVLMSRHAFNALSDNLLKYKPKKVIRSLPNIRGGKGFRCVKLCLPIKK